MGVKRDCFSEGRQGKLKLPDKLYIESLTSLRFFAILIVVVHHLRELIGWAPSGGWGAVGVTFFFVLSGFALSFNYQCFSTLNKVISFGWRRFARLYPLHFLTFLTSIFVIKTYNVNLDTSFSSAVVNLLLLQSWWEDASVHFAFNSLSWSISTLVFFYAVFVFIQIDFSKNVMIVATLSIISILISIYLIKLNNYKPIEVHWFLHMFPPNRVLVFILGLIAGKIFIFLRKIHLEQKFYLFSLLEALSILLIVDRLFSLFLIKSIFLLKLNVFKFLGEVSFHIVDLYIVTPSICLFLIFIFSFQNGVFSRFISKNIFVFFGDISFSIYMTHQIIFRVLSHYDQFPDFLLVIIAFAAIFFVSTASYFILEVRFFNILTKHPPAEAGGC